MRIKKGILLSSVVVACGAIAAAVGYASRGHRDVEENTQFGGFSGIIVNGLTEKPLSYARISAFRPDSDVIVETVRSDESGKFDLSLADGEYTIGAALDGYVSRGKGDIGRSVGIDGGTRFVNAKLRLWPPAKVHGRVVAGRAGISADIGLRYKKDASGAGDYEYGHAQTDNDGYFTIDGAYAGIATLSISAGDFASVDLDDIVLKSGISLDLGDIPLRDGVSLYGQIVDFTSKQPVSHARIAVSQPDGRMLATAQTSGDGIYRLIPLDMKQIVVDVTADGYHAEQYKMRLEGNANKRLSVALRRAWGMTLNVQNVTGRDPVQTHVRITDIAAGSVVYDEILANGTHALKSIKGGPFVVEAQSADRLTIVTKRALAGETVTLRLRPFARVVAHAINSDGTAMTAGQYRFYFRPDDKAGDDSPTPWLSFASSEFEISDLSEGLYRIEIRKAGDERTASSQEFALHHGDVREMSIRMTSGGAIRGHVVSTEGGYSLARATVTLDKGNRSVTTDGDGYFLIDELPGEPFTLTIRPAREEGDGTAFGGLTAVEDQITEREFSVPAPRTDERQRRHEEMKRRIENGEKPPWERDGVRPPDFRRPGDNSNSGGGGPGFGPPDWDGNGDPPAPPGWDGNGDPPAPPGWDGNGDPPVPPGWDGNGDPPAPPGWDVNGDFPAPPGRGNNGADAQNNGNGGQRQNRRFSENGAQIPVPERNPSDRSASSRSNVNNRR